MKQLTLLLFFLMPLSLFSLSVNAQQWNPEPPDPEDWDWIQLTSGEWLKGKLIVLYRHDMEFDSDELDTLILDWDDIQRIRTGSLMQLRLTGGEHRWGQLILEDNRISFKGRRDQTYAKEDVISITAGDKLEKSLWAVKYTLGVDVRSGNSKQEDITNNLKVQRRSVSNRLVFDYITNYSEVEDIETVNNHRATGSWDIFLSDALFLRPISAELTKDPFQNIEVKYSTSVGVGYQIVDTSVVEWLLVGGPGYQGTYFESVGDDSNAEERSGSFVTSSELDVEISSDVDFFYDYNFTFMSENAGRYSHRMNAGIEVDLGRFFDLNFSVIWDRTANPQPDEFGITPEQDDYRMNVGLGFEY